MASEESVHKAIAAAVKEIRAYYGEDVVRFSIDPMPSGEAPFQVLMKGADLPEAGLAQVASTSEATGAANAAKRNGRSGSGR